MRFEHLKSLYFSVVVFVMLIITGFLLSQHKLLWIDECFTQHVSVDKPSYIDILKLNFPDGNKSPLFYVLQKINANIFSFRYPIGQPEASYDVSDLYSQIIIRIPSNIYMSLALACIFYYFTRFFSLWTAIYALCVALVSPLVWIYWVEARPYSLWFLLTTMQLLFLCSTVHAPQIKVKKYISLINILLVFTTPGSILQVFIVTLVLFLRKAYRKRELIVACLLPTGIFLFYYFLVPVYKFKTIGLFDCLFEAALPERLVVYVLYALTAWWMARERKESSNSFFLPIFLLFLMSGCLVLCMDLFTVQPQFSFNDRYLIYLVPADTIMFTLASFDLWQWTRKNIWVCMNVTIFLGGLVIVRGLITYREILATSLYLHSGYKI